MATHLLDSRREHLHGHFSRDLNPILTVESGDTVVYERIPDAGWNRRPKRFEDDVPERIEPRDPKLDNGHCLVGPIYVKDAKPGQTLEIQIVKVIPADLGWTSSAGWSHEVHRRLRIAEPPSAELRWNLSSQEMIGSNQHGYEVTLSPFMGVMGMPTDVAGLQATPPPRRTGGNLDCKELVAGTSLFLPIEVDGGLFSTGDGHAAQGDGEVCVTAIECPMDLVELRFVLHPELEFQMPRLRKPGAWVTLGMDEDLDEAVFLALEEMTNLIGERHGIDRKTALALASVVVDVRVTQIVNGVKGAHAILPDDSIRNVKKDAL